ncbi:PucR family transcriptional regulator [Salipaludibacillus sp. HK11]|uniref:PucR family transcriptional regulator n=1 Tax=Salipaludibacillus sp. HK11 TaxID=3394320 RepID=UPI0039FD423F
MIDRLQKFYADAISNENLPIENRLTLRISKQDEIILDKNKLSMEEIQLLITLFDEDNTQHFQGNRQDKIIHEWLVEEKEVSKKEIANVITTPIRLIHFSISSDVVEQEEFSVALQGLFPASKSLVWKSKTEGLIIQQIDTDFDDELSINSIIDTLTSDFFVKVSFYIGSPIPHTSEIFTRYQWENHIYNKVKTSFPRKAYFIEQDISIHYLLHSIPEENLTKILKMIAPVKDDKTLLHSVKMYLECNLNASLAAKKLYMHRNTLQYRVDKFIEKTSIDIKQFPNAVSVYIMLLSIEPI